MKRIQKFIRSIRFRLTVWYLLVLAGLLLLFGTISYTMLAQSLYRNLDDSLKTRALEVENTMDTSEDNVELEITEQPGEFVLVYGSDGSLLQGLGWKGEIPHLDALVAQTMRTQTPLLATQTTSGREVRLYITPLSEEPPIGAIVVGRSTADVVAILENFNNILIVAGLTTLLLAGAGGFFMTSRVLKPVDRIRQAAQEIEENDLSRRIEIESDDELGRLASTLNQMIARLEAAFNRQRQFTADASHELRTPLAIVQAESTLALRRKRTPDDYRKSLELIAQEAKYMSAIIGKLLYLARIDAGNDAVNLERVNLGAFLAELCPSVEVLAREKDIEFQLTQTENLSVEGDRVKLEQLFLNLLENAIRYTPRGGKVSVSIEKRGTEAMVAITDTGIGIPEEHLPHLFERFYRVDKARSRAEGGAGLGLAICKHIVQVHHGRIEVQSQPNRGSTFSVFLPLANNDDNRPNG